MGVWGCMIKTHFTSFLTTNKTCCLQYFLFLLLLAPQVGKRVNDDAKDEVKDNNDDHEEEEQVVDHPGGKQGLLVTANTKKHIRINKFNKKVLSYNFKS